MLTANHFIGAAVAYLAFINIATYAQFWRDKRAARMRTWRVREEALLTLAMLGGTPAALIARRVLRHKTRKQPFGRQLIATGVIQALLIMAIAAWVLREFS